MTQILAHIAIEKSLQNCLHFYPNVTTTKCKYSVAIFSGTIIIFLSVAVDNKTNHYTRSPLDQSVITSSTKREDSVQSSVINRHKDHLQALGLHGSLHTCRMQKFNYAFRGEKMVVLEKKTSKSAWKKSPPNEKVESHLLALYFRLQSYAKCVFVNAGIYSTVTDKSCTF